MIKAAEPNKNTKIIMKSKISIPNIVIGTDSVTYSGGTGQLASQSTQLQDGV